LTQPNQYRREDSYYSFLSRQSQTLFNAAGTVVAASAFSVGFASAQFSIAADQALKICSADSILFAGDNLGKLVLLNDSIQVNSSSGDTLRTYPGRYGGQPFLGNGYALHASDQEWFFWNDYSEDGGLSAGPIVISTQPEVQNTDAGAAHTYFFSLTVIVEIYEKQKLSGLSGQQRVNRDAQGNFIP
jgi:hypothetical protein